MKLVPEKGHKSLQKGSFSIIPLTRFINVYIKWQLMLDPNAFIFYLQQCTIHLWWTVISFYAISTLTCKQYTTLYISKLDIILNTCNIYSIILYHLLIILTWSRVLYIYRKNTVVLSFYMFYHAVFPLWQRDTE